MSNQSRGNRYSNDFKQQIYELYNSGQSVAKLFSEYGIQELQSINGYQNLNH